MSVSFSPAQAILVASALAIALPAAAATGEEAAAALPPGPLALRHASAPDAAEEDPTRFVKLFRRWRSIDPAAPSNLRSPGAGARSTTRARVLAPAPARSMGRQLRARAGGVTMTSGFGLRTHPLLGGVRAHLGVDFAARMGTPVHATADGRVGLAGARGGYGLMVELQHGAGMETRYGHLSRLNVTAGQRVRKGDVIGFVGSTGLSSGPHLHYETRVGGRPVNPLPYIGRR